MQCHGGLKGPLRRILRSIGNEGIGATRAAHPQRHQTSSPSPSPSPSPPERCSAAQDGVARRSAFDSPRRPCSSNVFRPNRPSSSSRPYVTQSSPQTGHAELKDATQDVYQAFERDLSEPALYGSNQDVSTTPSVDSSDGPVIYKYELEDGASKELDPRVRTYLVGAPVKDTGQFSARYGANYRKVAMGSTRNRLKAHQIQQERHDYEGSDEWRDILRMLDDNTIADHKLYAKRLETVRLPEGVLARFNSNAGASLKEIMENTGCHVQIASGLPRPSGAADTFNALDLLGSSNQIEHALKVLPQHLDVMRKEDLAGPHSSSTLDHHAIERQLRFDEEIGLFSRSPPYKEEETYDESVVDRVEQELDELDDKDENSAPTRPPIRAAWTEDRTRKFNTRTVLHEPPKSVSRPLEVSAYVESLCESVPRSLRYARHKGQIIWSHQGHIQTVMKNLISLFSSPAIVRMATSDAVDRAIRFLAKHSNFAAFRELHAALEDGGYVFTTSNWNCCLAAAAKVGDVHNYQYTLKVMLRYQLKPDPITWATFHDLMCRRFPHETGYVLDTMRGKGLLQNNSATKLIAQNAVANDLKAHLALRGNLQSFLRHYDNRFSSSYGFAEHFNWLTVDVAKRMTSVLLSVGRSINAFEVLDEFRARNGERALDTDTLNTFLTSSLRDMDPKSAVATLQYFRIGQSGAIVPNAMTYRILFAIVWKMQYFNMFRVLWRYACCAGHIDFRTKRRMKRNLGFCLSSEEHDHSREHVWKAFAAKFAVGARSPEHNLQAAAKRIGVERQLIRIVSEGPLPKDSAALKERWKFLRNVFDLDFAQAGRSQPVLPLAECLRIAWEKDRDWTKRGLGKKQGYSKEMFREMLEDGIRVPTKAEVGMVETRAWEVPALLRQVPVVERGEVVKGEYREAVEREDRLIGKPEADKGEDRAIEKYEPII